MVLSQDCLGRSIVPRTAVSMRAQTASLESPVTILQWVNAAEMTKKDDGYIRVENYRRVK